MYTWYDCTNMLNDLGQYVYAKSVILVLTEQLMIEYLISICYSTPTSYITPFIVHIGIYYPRE